MLHRFLREVCISELDALRGYNLAPLASRRDMEMFGTLQKVNLGIGVPQLEALFPKLGYVE